MNLWSHRFSQNMNQNFCPVVWHSTGQKSFNIWFIFWVKRWLLKFNMKFTDLYARTSLRYGQITSPNVILWIILMGWTPGALFWCIFFTLTFYNLKKFTSKSKKSIEWLVKFVFSFTLGVSAAQIFQENYRLWPIEIDLRVE